MMLEQLARMVELDQPPAGHDEHRAERRHRHRAHHRRQQRDEGEDPDAVQDRRSARHGASLDVRSEEHTSELQSLMRISYAVFCLKKKTTKQTTTKPTNRTNTN